MLGKNLIWTLLFALFLLVVLQNMYPIYHSTFSIGIYIISALMLISPIIHFAWIWFKHLQRGRLIIEFVKKYKYLALSEEQSKSLATKAEFTPRNTNMPKPRVLNAIAWKKEGEEGELFDLNLSILNHNTQAHMVTTTCILNIKTNLDLPYVLLRAEQPGTKEAWAMSTIPWGQWDARTRTSPSGSTWILLSTKIHTATALLPSSLIQHLDSLPWRDKRGVPQAYLELMGDTIKLSTPILRNVEELNYLIDTCIFLKKQILEEVPRKTL